MKMVQLRLVLQVPFEEEKDFLSDKVAALLREIADFSEQSVRVVPMGNLLGETKVLKAGAFSWERTDT